MMNEKLKQWIMTHLDDYYKIMGYIFITDLEYEKIMQELVANQFLNMIPILHLRKHETFKSMEEYLANPKEFEHRKMRRKK